MPVLSVIIKIFFGLFHAVIFFCSTKVVSNRNPVYALLNLITIVILSALFLYMSGAVFLSYLLLLVHVGAVIVLFLFVIKMFNFRHIKEDLTFFAVFSKHVISLLIFFIINTFFLFDVSIVIDSFKEDGYIFRGNVIFDVDAFILVYTEYVLQFILITLILFITMISCIFAVLKIDQYRIGTI